MKSLRLSAVFLCVALPGLWLAPLLMADEQAPPSHLVITSAIVDHTTDPCPIAIAGRNIGPDPVVMIENAPVTVNGSTDTMILGEFACVPVGDYLLTVETGPAKKDYDAISLTVGAVGPIGPEGLQGPKGDKGDKGDQGDQGIQGIQGEQGDKGDKGDPGIQGIQGEMGDQGIEGPTGPRGPLGDAGPTGPIGPMGDTGNPGVWRGYSTFSNSWTGNETSGANCPTGFKPLGGSCWCGYSARLLESRPTSSGWGCRCSYGFNSANSTVICARTD